VFKETKHTAHTCGGVKTLKHHVTTTLRLAHYGCKILSHTSKTKVKHMQMVTAARFTIDAFLTF